jgi:hypothetical protein
MKNNRESKNLRETSGRHVRPFKVLEMTNAFLKFYIDRRASNREDFGVGYSPLKIALSLIASLFLLPHAESQGAGMEIKPTPNKQEVPITFAADSKSFAIAVPEDAESLVIERRVLRSWWTRWGSVRIRPGMTTYSLKIPARTNSADWRAFAMMPSGAPAPGKKYPAAFYRGARVFKAAASSGYADTVLGERLLWSPDVLVGGVDMAVAQSSYQSSLDAAQAQPKVAEADIWKTEGTMVYFFNQLRGLQVLDLSNPAEPALVCSLRLPAVGQDLYVLESHENGADLLLLARDDANGAGTKIHLVRVAGGKAWIVAETRVEGSIADSRLKGNRLFLANSEYKEENFGTGEYAFWVVSRDTLLHEVAIDGTSGSIEVLQTEVVPGASPYDLPIISAGKDWLAVSTATTWNAQTDITLYSIATDRLEKLTPAPIRTAGRIQDKFKLQFSDGVLTAISQIGRNTSTVLENFSVDGTLLGSLEIIKDESLFATRFAGDKAYAVTFRQTDPLWVLDLADPANPKISGHLEVPGWSTHLEPLGDLLFAIGVDSGRVEASLFDVSDPANPTLASRIQLSESWAYSEALQTEKALKILTEQNLALLPVTDHSTADPAKRHRVQLIEWDLEQKTLTARGAIAHDFEARRATVIGGSLASISQRELVTADISDRDNPAILADVMLAWPVHLLEQHKNHLLQISEGGLWWDEAPALRITSAREPDIALGEIALEPGSIRDTAVVGDRFHVLRTTGVMRFPFWRGAVVFPLNDVLEHDQSAKLCLDTYDLSRLPGISKVGTAEVPLDGKKNWQFSSLLEPSAQCVAVLVQEAPESRWFFPQPIAPPPIVIDPVDTVSIDRIDTAALSIFSEISPQLLVKEPESARAVLFDVSKPSSPPTSRTIELPKDLAICLRTAEAADRLILFGAGQKNQKREIPRDEPRMHFLGILDTSRPSAPAMRRPIDLPGRVLGFSDISRAGFLVWTDEWGTNGQQDSVSVSSCDLADVYEIDSITRPEFGQLAFNGRSVYLVEQQSVTRHTISNAGRLRPDGVLALDWKPESLRGMSAQFLASGGGHLMSAPMADWPNSRAEWDGAPGLDLIKIRPLANGDLIGPAGDYGVDIFPLD